MAYVKPVVREGGKTTEPVEAGCCLRSCGGRPRKVTPKATGVDSKKKR